MAAHARELQAVDTPASSRGLRASTAPDSNPGVSLRRVLQACDLAGFLLAWSIAWLTGGGHATTTPWQTLLLELAVITGGGMVLATAQGLYRTRITTMRVVAYTRLGWAAIGSAVIAFMLSARVDAHPALSRPVLGAVLAFSFTAVGRYGFDFRLSRARAQGRFMRRVVLVGGIDEVSEFHEFLMATPELGYLPMGIVGGEADPDGGITWLGPTRNARIAVSSTGSNGAIVIANGLTTQEVNETTRELTASGIHVHLSSGLFGVNYRRLRAVPLGHEPFLYVEPVALSTWQLATKRAMDILLSSVLLALTAPVLLVAAALIKLSDRGPVFFRQVRVGRNGKPITVHKLRTMSVDAEDRIHEIRHLNERSGPLFKTESDPRVTRVGALLRTTSIDELPQLLDVFRGDMSLVGPRPALPDEVAEFDDELLGRLRVRPGVTGLWQVEARDKPSFDAYRRLDLFYVENWSILLDMAIVIDTIPAVADRALRAIAKAVRRTRPVVIESAPAELMATPTEAVP
jgi:exopolysaccharide biosynthesis polyprenyl glycosylphosphotransferase